MSRFAFIGLDRHVYLGDTAGSDPLPLTAPLPQSGGAWSMLQRQEEAWSWPTWSPDGEWIAAFAVAASDDEMGPVRVVALATDGVRQVEWAHVPNMAPIYLQWHPRGEALSILTQQGQELSLSIVRRERLGHLRPIEQGVPLFFNWTPSGDRVLIHVGSTEDPGGRLVLRDPLGDGEDALHDRTPGSFCAPVFPDHRAVVALRGDDGVSELVRVAPDGSDPFPLGERRGLLAVLAAPAGSPWVAVSSAPRGESTPYQGIDLVHRDSGEVRALYDGECLAFFWSPTGAYLLTAVVDTAANCLYWHRLDATTGERTLLGSFWPTRDMLFFLHFFDQYADSHALLSPDGRWLLYAGYPAGGGQADLSNPPCLYLKDTTDPERPPKVVGRGSFGVFPNRR